MSRCLCPFLLSRLSVSQDLAVERPIKDRGSALDGAILKESVFVCWKVRVKAMCLRLVSNFVGFDVDEVVCACVYFVFVCARGCVLGDRVLFVIV